jgi:hypothetical protein
MRYIVINFFLFSEKFLERMITMSDCRMHNSAFDVIVVIDTHTPTQTQTRTHLIPERIESVVVDGCCPVLLRVLWGACQIKGGEEEEKKKRKRRRVRGGPVTQ